MLLETKPRFLSPRKPAESHWVLHNDGMQEDEIKEWGIGGVAFPPLRGDTNKSPVWHKGSVPKKVKDQWKDSKQNIINIGAYAILEGLRMIWKDTKDKDRVIFIHTVLR